MVSPIDFLCTLLYIIALESTLLSGNPVHAVPAMDIGLHSSQCHRPMTHAQVVELLQQQPCVVKSKQQSRIGKRDTQTTGTVDIHALQTTVNDHHTLINYIINNSLNTSILAEAINRHNAKRPPILSEWRDSVDMACIAFIVGALIYLLICRTGCISCGAIMAFFLRPVATHLNRQLQSQAQPEAIDTVSHKVQPASPIVMDIHRYNRGYSSD
jgi:hypothetical protein